MGSVGNFILVRTLDSLMFMTAKEFWQRFKTFEAIFRDELYIAYYATKPASDIIMRALKAYSEGLGYMYYNDKKLGKFVFCISANCNPNNFLSALTLVSQAPELPHWNIHALIPPLGYSKKFLNSKITLDGITIKLKHLKCTLSLIMWDGTYGITFVLPFYFKRKDQEVINDTLFGLLEMTLGERRCTKAILYMDIEYTKKEYFEYHTIDKLDKMMEIDKKF